MQALGFSHFGYDRDLHRNVESGDIERCLAFAAHFDSLDDLPWSIPAFVSAYRVRFPSSRFVLLERDERQWLRSYFQHFGRRCSEQEALAIYRNHNERIVELLAGERLLRMNICAGEGYEVLCPFLEVPVPHGKFPWENRSTRVADRKVAGGR